MPPIPTNSDSEQSLHAHCLSLPLTVPLSQAHNRCQGDDYDSTLRTLHTEALFPEILIP